MSAAEQPPASSDPVLAIRSQDYVDRKNVIRESNNHQRTTLALALGAFGGILGLLLDKQTIGNPTRLFLLLALAEGVAIVGASFTLGSAKTIEDSAEYVAEIEDSLGLDGWEARVVRSRTQRSSRRIWPITFGAQLALIYLALGAVTVYLRFELERHPPLTLLQALILWLLLLPLIVSCVQLARR